jgi:two-component system nitrogen regulation sensor histidine kinase NtrY
MPSAEPSLTDLNQLISETLAPFAEQHQEITFNFLPDNKLPELLLDREQMRRAVINLVDNATASILTQDSALRTKFPGRITIKTDYDRPKQLALIEVADNGPGVPANMRSRIFDPYVTTKDSGTGLGLAIVTSILADHHGGIRMYDNAPRGARFVAELPLSHGQFTQRRVGTGGTRTVR